MAYLRNEIFTRVCAEVEAHPTMTLARLAARLRVHRHTLTEIVRERTGVPFRVWRDRRLVERSQRLLRERGTRSIKEVSSLAGFGSTRAFDRFVKRHTGCRPRDLHGNSGPAVQGRRDLAARDTGPTVHFFDKRSAEDR